jgi:translation initiation factor IF-2
MSKVRVYELAKQLGVENKDLLKVIAGLGIEVKNHMSAVDEAAAAKIIATVTSPVPKKSEAARKSAPAPKKASAKDRQDHPGERATPSPAAHAPKTAKPSGKAAVAGPAVASTTPKAPGVHRTPASTPAPSAVKPPPAPSAVKPPPAPSAVKLPPAPSAVTPPPTPPTPPTPPLM